MMNRLKYPFLCFSLLSLLFACTAGRDQLAVDTLVQQLKAKYTPDQRTALFRINVRPDRQNLVLLGETTVSEARRALLDSLAAKKIAVVDSIVVLPDTSVGEKPWGLVTLSVVNMRAEPRQGAEMASQLLLGTPMRILQVHDDWYRVQSPDQYIGWCESSSVTRVAETALAEWKKSDRYVYNRFSGFAYEKPDEKSPVASDLVMDDLFTTSGETNGFLKMIFPDGRTGFVRKSECISYRDWCSAVPQVEKVIATAAELKGSPYLWGGTSTKGVDCSGLMKTAWLSQGVILARDASQQTRYGQILPVNDSLRFEPGDLLFFGKSKDRVTHVGMYIGNGRFIHSSGLVRVNSLNPQDTDYSEGHRNRLVSASRIVNSLNTEFIVQVKDHPWYN